MMAGPQDALIAKAAKDALQPLGFRRKGRSRIWLLDRDWWTVVVEFQPSGWTKGSYLNVAAHWLWSSSGHLSFDHGHRVDGFIEFESLDQFAPAARRMAESAAVEAERLTGLFSSIEATAAELIVQQECRADRTHGGWPEYNAAIAAGLAGMLPKATSLLASVNDNRIKPQADQMASLAHDPTAFRRAVCELIARQREALHFGPVAAITF